jgi:hypothetical protein
MGPILAVVAVGSVLALALSRASSRPSPAGFALLGTLTTHAPPRRLSIHEPGLNHLGSSGRRILAQGIHGVGR